MKALFYNELFLFVVRVYPRPWRESPIEIIEIFRAFTEIQEPFFFGYLFAIGWFLFILRPWG